MGRFLGYLFVWLVLAFALAGIVGGRAFDYYRLRNGGVLAEGVALGRKPHDQIEYSFTFEGRVYTKVGIPGMGAPRFEEIVVGQKLPIYYLPKSPEISCLGDPGKLFRNELPPVLLVILLFPSAIVGTFALKRRRSALKTGKV